jgi:hypothetical protein
MLYSGIVSDHPETPEETLLVSNICLMSKGLFAGDILEILAGMVECCCNPMEMEGEQ